MANTARRIWSAFLAVALALAFVPAAPAMAAEGGEAALALTVQAETSIAVKGEVTPESTTLTVDSAGLPDGARLYVAKFTAEDYAAADGAPGYGVGEKLFDSNDASWFTFENGEKMFYIGEGKLAAGEYVVAYVLSGWAITAQSAGVQVASDQVAGPSATIAGPLTAGDESLSVTLVNLPEGALVAIKAYDADETSFTWSGGDTLKVMNAATGAPVEGVNTVALPDPLVAGKQVVALVMTGYSDDAIVATSDPVVVQSAAAPEPAIAITGEVKADAASVNVSFADLPDESNAFICRYAAGESAYEFGWAATVARSFGVSGAAATLAFDDGVVLAEGEQLVAFIVQGSTAVAQSAPVTVQAAGGTSEQPTRAQIIAGTSVTMASPHADGVAAGKFMLTDTQATANVVLHDAVLSARLTIWAYPKAASFDPDQNTKNISLGSKEITESGSYTIEFNDNKSRLTTDYNILAYLYYQIPPEDKYDYQYKTSAGFELVDESGQTSEPYTYPKMSLVETELPTGATSLHVSLTGDERLFKLAQDTVAEPVASKHFQIHAMVIQYDASIENFDMGEDEYVRLWDAYPTEGFQNLEVDLEQPLVKGMKVRALCYWSQYEGDLTPTTIPRGVDYENREFEAVVVTDDAPPIVATPRVSIDGAITEGAASFSVTAKNLPDGALMFVQKFGADGEIAYNAEGSENLKVFSPYAGSAPVNGANAVAVESGALAAGDRVVAFVLAAGEVVAQSEPVTVAAAAAPSDGSISVAGPVATGATSVKITLKDAPEGAAVLVKSFASGTTSFTYDTGRAHGYNAGVANGENDLPLTFDSGELLDGYLVAFLLAGGDAIAQSEPVAIQYAAAVPIATIGLDGDDVALTQGDRFISLTWSVDELADSVSYDLYQFTGDALDPATATVLYHGALVTSKWNHSGTTWVPLNGALEAGATLQLVITADGQTGYSNTMTVGATPAWATVVPTIAFAQAAVKDDATSIKLSVNYPEEYATELGDQFYADIKVYQYPGTYTDEDFEDSELDENPSIAKVVAGANSSYAATNGAIEVALGSSVALEPGNRLIAKIRLPQAERQDHDSMWEDYLSMSVPVVSADANVPAETIFLYNLGADTAKGEKMREICAELGLEVRDLADADLAQKVGYIAGRDGYEASAEPYTGEGYDIEYMLMANISEASLDRLLAAMADAGVSIGAKGMTTEYNVDWVLEDLIGDIAEEHETITALVELQQLVRKAEAVEEGSCTPEQWTALQDAIAAAKALYMTEYDDEADEPAAEDYRAATAALEAPYLAATGMAKLDGQVRIVPAEQADGTFTLTASVEGATTEGLAYEFAWNDRAKTAGAVLAGVAADEVGARIVTVMAEGALGKLTAQLQAPAMPANLTVSANPGAVSVMWDLAAAGFNQPAATSYTAQLFQGDALVKEMTSEKGAALFSGLAAGDYTVKVFAMNAAGRSDKASAQVSIEAAAPKPPAPAAKTDISKATVAGVKNLTFNKKAQAQKPVVALGGKTLAAGKDYTVSYLNSAKKVVKAADVKNAGAYTVRITGTGSYTGTVDAAFTIGKARGNVVLKAKAAKKAVSVKAGKSIAAKKYVKVTKKTGKLLYKKAQVPKKLKKFLTVNKKNGKITVKKGAKKGTYTVKIKVTAKKSANYKAKAKTVKVKIRVK